VTFKNPLEESVYRIATEVCGDLTTIEHNKVIEIEKADQVETATFSGPPKKEVDIITAGYQPNFKLLISCKQYGANKAEPSDVQEWAAIVATMNKYSKGDIFFGLIISPSGFTSGCEGWATSSNLALIPPLKNKPTKFDFETSLEMTKRVLGGFGKRLAFPHQEILSSPGFYNFAFELTKDFEARDRKKKEPQGERYKLLENGWFSSFGELVNTLIGKTIVEVVSTTECLGLKFSEGLAFRIVGDLILFGEDDDRPAGIDHEPTCKKNLSDDDCTYEFVRRLVKGQRLTSAADFGSYFEFGLTNDINLGFFPRMLHVVRTRMPIEDNLL
jgi:hypothetical protein